MFIEPYELKLPQSETCVLSFICIATARTTSDGLYSARTQRRGYVPSSWQRRACAGPPTAPRPSPPPPTSRPHLVRPSLCTEAILYDWSSKDKHSRSYPVFASPSVSAFYFLLWRFVFFTILWSKFLDAYIMFILFNTLLICILCRGHFYLPRSVFL